MPTDTFGTILAVWAHPDDEIIQSSGLMALAARDHNRVVSIVATKGEQKSWKDKFKPPSPLGTVREKELLDALSILGIKEHHTLGYDDGACDKTDEQTAIKTIAGYITAVQPDTVLTFGPDGLTGDLDHQIISRWTTIAFGQAGKPGAKLFHSTLSKEWVEEFVPQLQKFNFFLPGYPYASETDELAINFSIPQDILEQKMAALSANTSQIGAMLNYFGHDTIKKSLAKETYILVSTHT